MLAVVRFRCRSLMVVIRRGLLSVGACCSLSYVFVFVCSFAVACDLLFDVGRSVIFVVRVWL